MTTQQTASEITAHVGNIVRSEINKNADYDLEAWIQSCVRLLPRQRVLDIGCGSGKQVKAFSDLVGSEGSVVGADIFGNLPKLHAAAEANLAGQKNVRLIDHDASFPFDFAPGSFDLINSAYSIYYVEDVEKTLNEFRRLIDPNGGRVFIVGPSWDNSSEFYDLHTEITRTQLGEKFLRHLRCMNDVVLPKCYEIFTNVLATPFVNRVYFKGSEGVRNLRSYYESSMMLADVTQDREEMDIYLQALEDRVLTQAYEDNGYVIFKRAIGVLAYL